MMDAKERAAKWHAMRVKIEELYSFLRTDEQYETAVWVQDIADQAQALTAAQPEPVALVWEHGGSGDGRFSLATWGELHISVFHPSRTVTFYLLGENGTRRGRIEIDIKGDSAQERTADATRIFNALLRGELIEEPDTKGDE